MVVLERRPHVDEATAQEAARLYTYVDVDEERLRALKAKRSLRHFIEEAWPILEPGRDFIPNWHIDAICEHLEVLPTGQLLDTEGVPTRNLLINIPPRHMKSLIVSVCWPAWEWIRHPELRYLTSSYGQDLALRDSTKTRRLITSPWYQRHWGHVFRLTGDQNAKERYENTKTGYRIATSVHGLGTGEGGDRIVVDDAHNVEQAESDVERGSTVTWWKETMSTRGNDPKTVCRVVVMQRLHERDVAGAMLEQGGYHHLCIPAKYEPRVMVPGRAPALIQPHDACPVYADPRAEQGALLWPDRFPAEVQASIERSMESAYAIAGQMQQRPVPREGAIFKAAQIRPLPADFDTPGPDGRTPRQRLTEVTYVDLAFSEKTSADYTAAVTVGVDAERLNLYILHVWRARLQALSDPDEDDTKGLVDGLAKLIMSRDMRYLGIEVGAFKQATTRDVIRRLYRRTVGHPVAITAVKVSTDKVSRALLPAGRAEAGLVYADKTAPWWPMFEAELLAFPKAPHDDQCDAFAGAAQLALEQPASQDTSVKPLVDVDRSNREPTLAQVWGPTKYKQAIKQMKAARTAPLAAALQAAETEQRVEARRRQLEAAGVL